MRFGQRRGRRSVAVALADPGAHGGTRGVVHDRGRLVANHPSGLVESPDEIDVLAEPHRLVEAAHRAQRIDSRHDDRRRHVAHPRPGPHPARFRAEIQRRSRGVVAIRSPTGLACWRRGARTSATRGSASWASSGSSHPSASVMSVSTNATNVVATAARPVIRAAAGPPLISRPRTAAPGIGLERRCRCVVDDDRRGDAGAPANDPLELVDRCILGGNHDRHLRRRRRRRAVATDRMDDAGIEQPIDQGCDGGASL